MIIQTDIANEVSSYIVTIVLSMSSKLKPYPSVVEITPSVENGLKVMTQVNTGQIYSIDKKRLGKYYGYLSDEDMAIVNAKLAYMVGLSID